ncbi:TetR/AcrR family transcriptional regulator [Desertihabitans brevis]|uniref:TetR/AcrR family transcriptional regulator n=1 Tax=Desertihabitans brevis TaxID=2268447 RepID=A0A367YZK2_9ACTN|nr:TetR/AcrR family transcriptional regulator [Desertihabitans brevis]RCK71335.1 TetR/AcrR family transcriptional regulator [Desertihabitans brevis]
MAGTGGRPRRSGVVSSGPREEILTVAAALFAEKGFSATRMSEIAEASGLRQSSIYYWFSSKDQLLRAIMEQNRVSLSAARVLVDRAEPAAARLYVVLYHDVVQMCLAPLNFYALEQTAHEQPEEFADFGLDYAELVRLLRDVVAQGVAAGEFVDVDEEDVVRTALSLTEGTQHRFHAGRGDVADVARRADAAATMAVSSLLREPGSLPAVVAAARAGIAGFAATGP